jgi:uncharacterized protein YdaT
MPWDKKNYPRSLKNFTPEVREKAVEIANALLAEGNLNEGIVIATAISRAKDCTANRDIEVRANDEGKITDLKEHGHDQYVIPKDGRWAVKTEKEDDERPFKLKEEAVKYARQKAREANAGLVIQGKDGRIQNRISYNPNRRKK